MIAIRVAIESASSWSCVTNTKVVPTCRWIRDSSACICLAELEVERAERLVEQEHRRPLGQGPCQRDPLLLPAGHLGRQATAQAGQPDQLEVLAGARA